MPNREELNEEAKAAGVENPEQFATKAELQEAIDKAGEEQTTPAEQAETDVEKSGVQGVTEGSTVNEDAGADEPDAKSDGANDEDQTVAVQAGNIDGVDRDHTPAGTTEEANQGEAADRLQPPVAANGLSAEATDEAYVANTQVNPALTAAEVREGELDEAKEKEEARKAESKVVHTDLGSSEEEAAAARAGVPKERLENPMQNREPKNEFEVSNQKVTEEERQAAQEVSDMTTKDRVENAPEPAESAKADAARTAETNQGADIAAAIVEGLKSSKEDKTIKITNDENVEPRFSLVRNKQTGEVLIRENETRILSKVQLESLEEKEASLQETEVEEL